MIEGWRPMWWNRQTRCLEGAVEVSPCQFESGHRHRHFDICALAVIAIFAVALLAAPPANALLMGEKAEYAPLGALRTAGMMYEDGDSHKRVWQKTGWYCPQRRPSGCRWELDPGCTKPAQVNITAIRHTAFTGKIPLWQVFNASCVWQQYPQLQNKVVVFSGTCRGALGTASHDGRTGEICISSELLQKIKNRAADAKKNLYLVFLHELQHQVQFAEKWSVYNTACPYRLRKWEREAFYVSARESLSRKQRRKTPPAWFEPGLC